MHVVIVGCGRVGSSVANQLSGEGHDVVVIDRNADAFRRLGDGFTGRTINGIGFDRQVLADAGLQPEGALLAVTNGDNTNILVARVGRELFGVERVVARIYDPKRAAIYERLGVPTVASVAWTAERVLHHLHRAEPRPAWIDPNAQIAIVEISVPGRAAGVSISAIEGHGSRIVSVARLGVTTLADPATLLQEGDVLHVAVPVDQLNDSDAWWAATLDHEEGHR